MAANASSLSIDLINNSVGTVIASKEVDLRSLIQNLGDNADTAELLQVQAQVQQWLMMTELQSTLVKQIADTMKGVIQKSS